MSKLKAVLKYPEIYENDLQSSSCLLTISVGQATHENEMFAETMALVNRSFASCVLLVDDLLQRHTMQISSDKPAEYFYEVAQQEGDLWLQRNKRYYDSLTIPLQVLRWEKWLYHPKFKQQLEIIKNTIDKDADYKAVIDKSINDFLAKLVNRGGDELDLERAYQLSLDFVTEECAALCLWTELGCGFEAYPIRHNEAINKTREVFVLPVYPKLLRPITIKFKNAKQIKPQNFLYTQQSD